MHGNASEHVQTRPKLLRTCENAKKLATKLRQIVRKALVQESREVPDIVGAITGVSGEKNRRKGIMGIVKQYGGKRIPKEGPWAPSQYEFPDEQIAAQVVWLIHDFTGREAVNSGKVVSVYK